MIISHRDFRLKLQSLAQLVVAVVGGAIIGLNFRSRCPIVSMTTSTNYFCVGNITMCSRLAVSKSATQRIDSTLINFRLRLARLSHGTNVLVDLHDRASK